MSNFESRRREVEARTRRLQELALKKVGEHIKGAARTNSRKRTGDTGGSFTSEVTNDGSGSKVIIGSNQDNAIYEEFGTGIHAEKGGRKTPWVYKDKKTGEFYKTRGKTGTRALRNAGEQNKSQAQTIIRGVMSGGMG
ncbi:HK97 gp10 family phage protein [Bacillus sp. COPE52]|uniref:HK97 gp10 family phage protein n=1 Tax=Bacillus sp. COPE52 TaxID=2233998 RepID=UPI000E10770F|nr:HK97 gp10 family phage protein [Bacillus sp. COPE52]AXK19126.1 HK97 gp10 family phage protein [Bacillus sp. COPE52]